MEAVDSPSSASKAAVELAETCCFRADGDEEALLVLALELGLVPTASADLVSDLTVAGDLRRIMAISFAEFALALPVNAALPLPVLAAGLTVLLMLAAEFRALTALELIENV